jgi:hypothetical protein
MAFYLFTCMMEVWSKRFSWKEFWIDFPSYVGVCLLASLLLAFMLLKFWMFLKLADWML